MARAYVHYLLSFYESKEARKEERTRVREILDPFDLPEAEFLQNYKVSPQMVQYLCQALNQDLAPKTPTGYSTVYKVLASLKVLLSGHYQRGVGNEERICVAQRTVSKYLGQFLDSAYARLTPLWVSFPASPVAREQIAARYEEKYRLPHILGCVDCTHVSLFPPPKPTQAQYINRHGVTSINVQLISDADCRILNVNANYPGRVHDQFIFNQSLVKEELRRLHANRIGQYYLLGDSGYALEPWMMTPIRNAVNGTPDDRYTQWHCRTRNLIERTNGYLKGTFRCLGIDRSIHYDAEQASKIVYVSCTLYNIMKYFRVPMQFVQPTPEERGPNPYDPNPRLYEIAVQKRAQIVREYFT